MTASSIFWTIVSVKNFAGCMQSASRWVACRGTAVTCFGGRATSPGNSALTWMRQTNSLPLFSQRKIGKFSLSVTLSAPQTLDWRAMQPFLQDLRKSTRMLTMQLNFTPGSSFRRVNIGKGRTKLRTAYRNALPKKLKSWKIRRSRIGNNSVQWL